MGGFRGKETLSRVQHVCPLLVLVSNMYPNPFRQHTQKLANQLSRLVIPGLPLAMNPVGYLLGLRTQRW